MIKWFYRSLILCSLLLVCLPVSVWLTTFHPDTIQQEIVHCPPNTPALASGQPIKVYNQNVQFMAGKNYVFFYELPNNSGPDDRPSSEDIKLTGQRLAQFIRQQDPDIIILQELDEGAKRTDHMNQLDTLLKQLPKSYACYSSSFYWKSSFVPHPRILGSVGLKLAVISKYKISSATRIQLALVPQDPISQQYNLKRALMDVRLPIKEQGELAVLNTHLSAFPKGGNLLEKQVAQIDQYLARLNQQPLPWILAGDFNLLPTNAYTDLAEQQRTFYNPHSEIKTLYQHYAAIPSLKTLQSNEREQWFSYFPNDPLINKPDRTLDYFFYDPSLTLINAELKHEKTLSLSDHLPLVARFNLP